RLTLPRGSRCRCSAGRLFGGNLYLSTSDTLPGSSSPICPRIGPGGLGTRRIGRQSIGAAPYAPRTHPGILDPISWRATHRLSGLTTLLTHGGGVPRSLLPARIAMQKSGLAELVSSYGARKSLGDSLGIATGMSQLSGMRRPREPEFAGACSALLWLTSLSPARIYIPGAFGFGLSSRRHPG